MQSNYVLIPKDQRIVVQKFAIRIINQTLIKIYRYRNLYNMISDNQKEKK